MRTKREIDHSNLLGQGNERKSLSKGDNHTQEKAPLGEEDLMKPTREIGHSNLPSQGHD